MRRIIVKCLFLTVILLTTGCVSSPFFHPTHKMLPVPEIEREEVTFHSSDYTTLHGWFMPSTAGPAKATVIFYHGNAQNLTYHCRIVSWLMAHGYNVFIFDYRGYGKAYGTPTIPSVVADGYAAMKYLQSRPDVDGERLLVYGQSLGGAIAVAVVGKYQPPGIRGMLIDSAFSSYQTIAAEKLRDGGMFWPLPAIVAYCSIRGGYNPKRYVDKLAPRPVQFLHGGADRIVPKHHSEQLYRLAKGKKGIITFPGARHIEAGSMYESVFQEAVLGFFKECLKQAPAKPKVGPKR
jgi:fermentation-respiration switch protein FrsA (DUF1100 family)